MKVTIGPYINYFGPYQLADLFRYVGVSEEKCEKIGEYLSDTSVGIVLNKIHDLRKRKVKVKIHRYDSYSADHTLAYIILPVLKQLRDSKHGSPGDMPAFMQTSQGTSQFCFDFYAEEDDIAWDIGHEQWKEILNKMIWSFEQILDDNWEDQYWEQKPEVDTEAMKADESELASIRWKTIGKCDWVGMQKHQDRIQEGLELFGKYYTGLWD